MKYFRQKISRNFTSLLVYDLYNNNNYYYYVCLYVAGVVWFSEDGVELALAIAASKAMTFAGLYCHEGHSYSAHDADEIRQIGDEVAERILDLAKRFVPAVVLIFISSQ